MRDRAVTALASRQHSLVTRAQVREHLSEDELEHRLATGRLVSVRHGVYRVGGAAVTWRQCLLGAVLAAGPGTVASFRAAAALWGLRGFEPDVLEITVRSRRRVRLRGVVVHDSRVTGAGHVASVDGITVTSVARTLCDLTGVVPWWVVKKALDDAERRGLVTFRQVERVFGSLATRGRRRSTVMRALLEARMDEVEPGGSDPEAEVVRWLVAAGLPKPVQQHRIRIGSRTVRLDAAYPDTKVAIEYDGWDFHRTRSAFDDDRARANELEVRGWMVLRFTSASTRATVVDTVAGALDSRRRITGT